YSGECVVSHLTNGGFEGNRAPSLNTWNTSGTVGTSSFARTGWGALLLGSFTGSPTGQSTASQTFDFPDPYGGGTVTLSFWYAPGCMSQETASFGASLAASLTGTTLTAAPPRCASSACAPASR